MTQKHYLLLSFPTKHSDVVRILLRWLNTWTIKVFPPWQNKHGWYLLTWKEDLKIPSPNIFFHLWSEDVILFAFFLRVFLPGRNLFPVECRRTNKLCKVCKESTCATQILYSVSFPNFASSLLYNWMLMQLVTQHRITSRRSCPPCTGSHPSFWFRTVPWPQQRAFRTVKKSNWDFITLLYKSYSLALLFQEVSYPSLGHWVIF